MSAPINNTTNKTCIECRWYMHAPAGPYCVNPIIKANKTSLAIYGTLEGQGMQLGLEGNECGYVRHAECGMEGKLWEKK